MNLEGSRTNGAKNDHVDTVRSLDSKPVEGDWRTVRLECWKGSSGGVAHTVRDEDEDWTRCSSLWLMDYDFIFATPLFFCVVYRSRVLACFP